MGGRRDALLFDLDGTLVDSAPAIAKALTIQRERRRLPPITAALVRPWISLGADVLVARGLASGAGETASDLAEFRALLGALPANVDSLYPDVIPALTALVAAGFKMAVATNKPERLSRQLLVNLGLDPFFGAVVGGDSTPFAKPHPAPLVRALELLGATAERSFFLGDSDVDCEAARRLGIPFLLFTGGYGANDCPDDHVSSRFDDYALLASLITSLA